MTSTLAPPLPAVTCPRHGCPLTGGPVLWHCDAGGGHGHAVPAADLSDLERRWAA